MPAARREGDGGTEGRDHSPDATQGKEPHQRAWLDPWREMMMFGVAAGWEAAELGDCAVA